MNKRIKTWFESGKILQAIEGEEGCFIPEVSYKDEHDKLLVLQQLSIWADTPEKRKTSRNNFFQAIELSLERGNLKNALDLIYVYCISQEDGEGFLEKNELIPIVSSLISDFSKSISEDRELIDLVLEIEHYFPEVRY